MPVVGYCGLILIVISTICLLHTVMSAHLGTSTNNQRTTQDPKRRIEKDVVQVANDVVADLPPFADRLPQSSKPQVNLFEEYMSRGLYTCTSSYLDALGKLHALIAEVYEDYQACQKMMKTTTKTFSRTDIDALDDLLDEWEKEDAIKETEQLQNQQQNQQMNEKSSQHSNNLGSSSSTTEPRIPLP
uniref:Uncharacterized protein n=1 Tax=Panagrolaimus sp. JU765 TaxID=591449 RepID=A0AC34PZ93_9BILA